ncbi:acetyltransferase, GNAT family protein [Pedobacter sp. BAL39]|uniref:GNAT family N-acetyltransferase n=1 Tax=Pedobacter sp. BAL39 TaxID=391596 RepID=UPI00015595F6|nr:GNAT family N-acetyltransferase [Pedobacter sp. BAL39]EDM38022.1 acetyltransferase, GNAT family protein [Pedobacter sp. BAL39]
MSTINLTITQIFNDDCKEVIDLILPIQQIEFNVPITIEGQPDLLDIESNYHQTGGNFWAAKVDGELVGTIALLNTGHNACALRKMFVKKEFRGKEYSIAQKLLETLVAYCRENNITEIYLGTVDMLKAAHRFYEKNDFNLIEVTDLPSYFPRMMADNKFYHLHLDL